VPCCPLSLPYRLSRFTGRQVHGPGSSLPPVQIDAGITPTFGFFLNAAGDIPVDAANSRVFVRFTDSLGVICGSTSVAVAIR